MRLADVAEVGDGSAEQRGFARLNGRPAVAFQVNKTKRRQRRRGGGAGGQGAIDEARQGAPRRDLHPGRLHRGGDPRELRGHRRTCCWRAWCWRRWWCSCSCANWRATAIAAMAMPLSLIPTFAVMRLLGFSLNMVTLLALTLVIGILVDDAIVEIENIEKRIERGPDALSRRADRRRRHRPGGGGDHRRPSWWCSRRCRSCRGISGQFFREFGLTVAVAVLFSLLVARLLTPLLAAYFLKAKHARQAAPSRSAASTARRWTGRCDHRWLAADPRRR